MSINKNRFERGSKWRQWDLHIHTPASFHWGGQKFDADPNSITNADLVDEMISALNSAEPAVFALMDYWTFEGWFALKKRLGEAGAPKLLKTVFLGIELRLAYGRKSWLKLGNISVFVVGSLRNMGIFKHIYVIKYMF
jgi:hypothetical protein